MPDSAVHSSGGRCLVAVPLVLAYARPSRVRLGSCDAYSGPTTAIDVENELPQTVYSSVADPVARDEHGRLLAEADNRPGNEVGFDAADVLVEVSLDHLRGRAGSGGCCGRMWSR